MNMTNQILIVDDVLDNIQVAMNILKEDNYDLAFARNGVEALELIKFQEFDLILLDIMMPEMDGFQVCTKLKENEKTRAIPIIFLTAKVDVDSIAEGFELGAVDYVTKPFHANELLARVKTHLQLANANKELKELNAALKTKSKLEHHRLTNEIEDTQKEVIYMLTSLMESFSDETGKHISRVAEYSRLLAHYYGLNDDDAEIIYAAAPMHDIGKIAVDSKILHKKGKLTTEEYTAMKEHATFGHKILQNSQRKILKAAEIIAYQHHEKWDGSGYPRGLKAENIHIYGRIVSFADVFDALSNPRAYKKAWSKEEVLNYITEEAGKHFDPHLVELFLKHQDEFVAINENNQ
ncbi:MAG: response regulator [Methylococcaceae bacterium]|nr:response regulator [Methylococcaceae bacterium]